MEPGMELKFNLNIQEENKFVSISLKKLSRKNVLKHILFNYIQMFCCVQIYYRNN